jgi:hypothetical protein
MTENITTLARADLADLHSLLTTQRVRRLDVIAPATQLSAKGGRLRVADGEPAITEDGVTQTGGLYTATSVFDDGLAQRLGVPFKYLRTIHEARPSLYDQTVNAFLHGSDGVAADERKFLVRLFRGDTDGTGIARALLSDRFKTIDNLDVLTAVLGGMGEAGLGFQNIGRCDLTERKMFVQVQAPEISVLAPALLAGYRSPYSGLSGSDIPQVFAGFVISNSEAGYASASITPRIVFRVCSNGMTMAKDALTAVHVGVKREEGLIRYSDDTMEKELALITAKTRDAVSTFLSKGYVEKVVRELEAKAGVEVTKPEETVKAVVAAAGIPKALEDAVFANFIRGGQLTAGGVMQAVTATAQDQDNADLAYELEGLATDVLAHAARLA